MKSNQDPLIKAGVVHLYFLTVHPFDDGNGRLARALTDWVLASHSPDRNSYLSLSTVINKEKSAYYMALEKAQKSGTDVTEFLLYFLETSQKALHQSELLLSRVLFRALFYRKWQNLPLNPRQIKVLNKLTEVWEGGIKSTQYGRLTSTSPDTALRDINQLVEWGLLVPSLNSGRSKQYFLPPLP